MAYKDIICEMKSYIQPFERLLALQELHAIAGVEPVPEAMLDDKEPIFYRVATGVELHRLVERLTYWETVRHDGDVATPCYTRQVRYEATSDVIRNGVIPEELPYLLPLGEDISPNKRRNLRYGSHGVHEYRGKFFPQLVRSLLNISATDPTGVVVDPMCGSGTALVESSVLGYSAYGLDMNPLSVLMSQAKTEILTAKSGDVLNEFKLLESDILSARVLNHGGDVDDLPWFASLPQRDRDYLKRWFAPEILAQLDPVMMRVQKINSQPIRKLFLIALSNIVRSVSWQKDDDLRVRKQSHLETDADVIQVFLDELQGSVKAVMAFLIENQGCKPGAVTVIEGDARQPDMVLRDIAGQVNTIITSPPYATALPYLDTDRLSLSYLKLLPRPKHRKRDYLMIGNREITERYRQNYLELYRHHKASLPSEITEVIDLIHNLNQNANVGFRRRNLSALLAKYFLDMREVMGRFAPLLQSNGYAYVVIGNNHTIAGGQRVEIPSDVLLCQLGESIGLHLEDVMPMDMLVSRDIFKKNAGSAETILCFRN